MRALVYHGPKDMKIEERPIPQPAAGQVRIRTAFVGICGSDVHGWLGVTGRRIPPMIMGHEFSGIISALGEGVTGWNVGDPITVQPMFSCGKCGYCAEGLTNLCDDRKFMGAMDNNGAFMDEFCVPVENLCALPENVSLETGALIEPFAVAYRGILHAGGVKGKTVMICGAGTIGLMALKVCKLLEAGTIIVVDLSDDRLELARKHGADITINGREDIGAALTAAGLRNQIDVAVEAVGVTPTAQQTVEFVKTRGTIVWIGNSAPTVTVNMQSIVTRELTIYGSYIYTDEDFRECIRLLSEKPQDFTGIISEVIPVEQAQDAFEELSHGATAKIKVLVDMRL
ncbi:MAG: galactitol-1-phosphate 5-dehydrogenase [Oscillospiraceae bacterium]|nr:galactitol-1-phosphate 5-dehydrogenase [Oscillospiraceae bacterium]